MIPKKEGSVTIQYKGKDFSGFYRIEEDMIVVSSRYGDKTTQLGSLPPIVLAQMLLREIIKQNIKK